jgi:hypothetical protein
MSYLDFIREIRKGEPEVQKAANAMELLGWLCVFGAMCSYVSYYYAPFDRSPFNLLVSYRYHALIVLLILGAIFLFSARGIRREGAPWSKKLGQLAVILLAAVFIGSLLLVFPADAIPSNGYDISTIHVALIAVLVALFVVPAYWGVRYLERLPGKDEVYSYHRVESEYLSKVTDDEVGSECPTIQHIYQDAIFPYGLIGNFAVFFCVIGISMGMVILVGDPHLTPFFILILILAVLSSIAYNFVSSPFERARSLIASCTGGGKTTLRTFRFRGTWPFFRLMVYGDGVEVRVMFNRFFIPYDKMENLSSETWFFIEGLYIESDLRDVPSSISFYGIIMRKALEAVDENARKYGYSI